MFAAEICINLENLDVAPIAAVYIVFMWVFFIVTRLCIKRVTFELESLALFLSSIGILLASSHSTKTGWVQLASAIIGVIGFCLLLKFIEIPDRVMKWQINYNNSCCCSSWFKPCTWQGYTWCGKLDCNRSSFDSAIRICKDSIYICWCFNS